MKCANSGISSSSLFRFQSPSYCKYKIVRSTNERNYRQTADSRQKKLVSLEIPDHLQPKVRNKTFPVFGVLRFQECMAANMTGMYSARDALAPVNNFMGTGA